MHDGSTIQLLSSMLCSTLKWKDVRCQAHSSLIFGLNVHLSNLELVALGRTGTDRDCNCTGQHGSKFLCVMCFICLTSSHMSGRCQCASSGSTSIECTRGGCAPSFAKADMAQLPRLPGWHTPGPAGGGESLRHWQRLISGSF